MNKTQRMLAASRSEAECRVIGQPPSDLAMRSEPEPCPEPQPELLIRFTYDVRTGTYKMEQDGTKVQALFIAPQDAPIPEKLRSLLQNMASRTIAQKAGREAPPEAIDLSLLDQKLAEYNARHPGKAKTYRPGPFAKREPKAKISLEDLGL